MCNPLKQRTYKILLTKEPERVYTATVPVLPGCIIYGDNVDHAIAMAKEAIELYIERLEKRVSQFLMIVIPFNIHFPLEFLFKRLDQKRLEKNGFE